MFSIDYKVERQGKRKNMDTSKEKRDEFPKVLFSCSYLLQIKVLADEFCFY